MNTELTTQTGQSSSSLRPRTGDAHMKRGHIRLLALANFIEKRNSSLERHGLEPTYAQQVLWRDECGTPGCALGHATVRWPGRNADVLHNTQSFFDITRDEDNELFASSGCDFAGTDWRKAVRYIRDFVARKYLLTTEGGHDKWISPRESRPFFANTSAFCRAPSFTTSHKSSRL